MQICVFWKNWILEMASTLGIFVLEAMSMGSINFIKSPSTAKYVFINTYELRTSQLIFFNQWPSAIRRCTSYYTSLEGYKDKIEPFLPKPLLNTARVCPWTPPKRMQILRGSGCSRLGVLLEQNQDKFSIERSLDLSQKSKKLLFSLLQEELMRAGLIQSIVSIWPS